jgi:hypothetical protein
MAVSSYRYQTRLSDEDLRARLVELAREKPRFGYRRLHVLLQRGGDAVMVPRSLTILGLAISLMLSACESSSSEHASESEQLKSKELSCEEPQNPYSEGSGHYAGFEWAEKHEPASCGGNSQSFIEGCEEWQRQDEDYEACENKSQH